ncbi:helix-turn-helix domain-containing protein [Phenylobacterium sp.]|uniref:helix-turn-helix domain-containing protein n=1 Tax=Phenylobacterium sp. TaxID=1871053 RepID=UPI0025F1F373|nr:helix-turn-helix domain-containing protein [Phenylobacterium sp.]
MSEEVYTVEQFAERLKLHPKTVLRFIREGRLRAVKVGKSYRILRSELEAMTGVVRSRGPAAAARVTSIVDLPGVDPELARRLARQVPAVRTAQEAHPDPMSLDVAYDPARRALKIVIVGSIEDTAVMLKMVQVMAGGAG